MRHFLLPLLLVAPLAQAYELKFPEPDWPAGQAAVETFKADFAAWEKDPNFFELPAAEPAWPCAVSEENRYKAAGLSMALPDFAAKMAKMTRKHFRELGMDPAAADKAMAKYEEVKIVPLRGSCKAGKLDGDVEVLVQYLAVSEFNNTTPFKERYVNSKTVNRSRFTQRVVSQFAAGNFKTMQRSIGKMQMNSETTYDDAEFNAMVKNSSSMATSNAITDEMRKRPMLMFIYPQQGNHATFNVSQEPKISSGLFGVNADFKDKLRVYFTRPTGDDTDDFIGYEDGVMNMRSPRRGGKMHGDMVTWTPNYLKASNLRIDQMPNMERARIVEINGVEMIENRQCHINGVPTKTTDCPTR